MLVIDFLAFFKHSLNVKGFGAAAVHEINQGCNEELC
jgi:hypothetical protein